MSGPIPLLSQEGWLRHQENAAKPPKLVADGVVPQQNPASRSFGTTPPARPFLEFDGLAGTPPNSGGENRIRAAGRKFALTVGRQPFLCLTPRYRAGSATAQRPMSWRGTLSALPQRVRNGLRRAVQ